ncbi:MAG: hypothetical protein AAFU74_11560 [Bacteroidota bacterium]
MKKAIFIFLLLLVAITGQAQQLENFTNTVTVYGHAVVPRETKGYRIKATLSMDQLYYAEPNCTNLEELKTKYFKALKEKGFDPAKFKESKSEFLLMGYQKDGTILDYETTSKSELELLSSVKMSGVALSYQFKSVFDPKQRKSLLAEIMENAKANAELICEGMGKKPGKILSVSGDSPKEATWVSYAGSAYDEYWSLTVIYKME